MAASALRSNLICFKNLLSRDRNIHVTVTYPSGASDAQNRKHHQYLL